MSSSENPSPSSLPRWLSLLLAAPVAIGVLLAIWYCLILDRPRFAFALLGIAVGYLLLKLLSKKLRLLRLPCRVLGIAEYVLAFAAWSVMAYPAYIISPARTVVLLAGVVVAFALEHYSPRRPPWGALVLIPAMAAALNQWHPMLLALPLVAALAFAAWRWRPAWTPRGALWLLLLWCAVICSIIVPFYRGAPPARLKEVLAQPGVTLLYNATDENSSLYPVLGPEPRFGRPDCYERVLVGTRFGPLGLVRLDPQGTTSADLGPVSDFVALDCGRKRVIAGEATRGVIKIFDHDSLALRPDETLVEEHLHLISELVYVPAMNQLFASGDDTKRLFVHDFGSNLETTYDTKGFVTDFAVFPEAGRLIITSWGGLLFYYDLSPATIRLLSEMRLPDLLLQLTPDPDGQTLWITGLFRGELIKFSVAERKVLARVSLGAGVRFCAVDLTSNTLFVTNFFTGELIAVDRATLRPQWRRFLGARLRNVNVFPRSRKLVAASALGLFEIKLP